jgi:NADH-quinone oxidoreductase subunit L
MRSPTSLLVWLSIFFPLIGAVLTPILARISVKLRDYGAVFFSFLSALCGAMLISCLFEPSRLPLQSSFSLLSAPIRLEFGVLLDPLSIILTVVVTVISFFIMVYSLGYMKGESGLTRYWMLMNLFIGSMLLLVLSNNLLFLFVGWKMVGLCSYGLIGFRYKDEKQYWIGGPEPSKLCAPSHAGLKALITTSAGDVLLLGGILILFFYSGTTNLSELYRTAPNWIPEMAKSPGVIILATLMLLAGPIGKSAQFPLHEWLPEAMAGPTPVSALIHAATMVKSGVYLVARLVPLFYYAYWIAGSLEASFFFYAVAWIGVFTAFLAATQGMVALELKKALAYSTVSQIGYMWIGLGLAGFTPALLVDGFSSGIFHLVTHALFKASLFLCAGTVLHAAHTIYMNEMGGLQKSMPITWLFMLIAALSLIGLPPLPGFWSKDAILACSLESGSFLLYFSAMITVPLTAFYTVRMFSMVFHGQESAHIKGRKKERGAVGDGYLSMWCTCAILSVAILLLGIFGPKVEHVVKNSSEYMLLGQAHVSAGAISARGSSEPSLPALPILLLVAGAIPAYLLYFRRKVSPGALLRSYPVLKATHTFLWNRWYIDAFYYRVVVKGIGTLSRFIAASIEDRLDGFCHRLIPTLPKVCNEWLRRLRTESNQMTYNLVYILALLIFFFVLLSSGNH